MGLRPARIEEAPGRAEKEGVSCTPGVFLGNIRLRGRSGDNRGSFAFAPASRARAADRRISDSGADLTQKGFEGSTGAHYNYFRDYDPAIGRYVESDPIGLEGGLNTYSYVAGNPVRLSDPSGLQVPPVGVGGIGGASAGGAAAAGGTWWGSQGGSGSRAWDGSDSWGGSNNSCPQECPECKPYAAGTIGYIGPHLDHDHYPIGRPHINLFVVRQRKSDCKCFWNKANPDVASPPPRPGWVDLNSGFPLLTP
jgi:RHS repeat-associated protein